MRSVSRARRAANARLRHLQALFDRRAERLQRVGNARLHGEIAGERAHRHSARRMDPRRYARRGSRPADAANADPRHVRSRARSPNRRRPAGAPGSKPKCIGWLDGRQTVRGLCVTTGMAQRSARCASTLDRGGAQRGGNDERALSRRDPFRRASRCYADRDRRRAPRARRRRPDRLGQRRRQRLARQHQIDRPARMRHRDFTARAATSPTWPG